MGSSRGHRRPSRHEGCCDRENRSLIRDTHGEQPISSHLLPLLEDDMKNPRLGSSKRVGIAGVVVAALGLLFGLAFVAPAGAQDGGDSYTLSLIHISEPTRPY